MADHVEGPLHWEQVGKHGRPMVFIHPNPMDHSCWLYQMAHFSTWFKTIGIDLPGYGRSPKAKPGLTMPDVAEACWEAVDEVTEEAAVLVGLSVGVSVAMHMASQRPERTLALILSGFGYYPVKEFAPKRIAQYRQFGIEFRRQHALDDFSPAFRQSAMGQYFANMFVERNERADASTIIEMFSALAQPDPDWLFEGVRSPTLIITGSLDNAHKAAFALKERISGCELMTIEGAGHACNMEQPWEWDRHAVAFLTKHGLIT